MAIFKTLKDLQDKTEKPAGPDGPNRYFTVKDGEQFVIRFRQELTLDAENYDSEIGTAEVLAVHTNPDNFRKSARCTADMEEFGHRCWACEQIDKNKGWRAKNHLVTNVAVYNEDEEIWEPRVLDHKFTPAHIANDLLEFASEYGTVTDRDYKLKRKGQKQNTQYSLTPLSIKDADESLGDMKMHELTNMYKVINPAEQAGFYVEESDTSDNSSWD